MKILTKEEEQAHYRYAIEPELPVVIDQFASY